MITELTVRPQAASAAAQRHVTKATNAAAVAQAAAKTPKHAVNPAVLTPASPAAALNTNATARTSNAVPAMAVRPRTQLVADLSITARQAQHVVSVHRKTMMGRTIISVLQARHVLIHFIST